MSELLLGILRRLQVLMFFTVRLYQSQLYSDELPHVTISEAIQSGDPGPAAETLKLLGGTHENPYHRHSRQDRRHFGSRS